MRIRLLLFTVMLAAGAAPAHAELVFFANGQAMSIKGHRADGDSLVLMLRGGGELTCDPSTIVRFLPDEVSHDEDAQNKPQAATPTPRAESLDNAAFEATYGAVIDKVAAAHGVPARLVRAVITVESAGQAQARSPKGAVGLMQLMPATGRRYTTRDLYDPLANLEAGITHLRTLLDRFPLALALAAYNAGEAAVDRFGGIPPYPETQRYVARILQLIAP